ncbi:helix-turn-helix domain-containing protein [Micromonospora sp. DT233]|uniref:helix-turn-helix domain-containing protein n=1 Tax=Micromonospora sp. DT233 TaxID=3393432 RepID=UPI003CF4CC5C
MLDSLQIPGHLWWDKAVRAALDARDVGALFRHVSRLAHASQTRIGAAVGLEQGYVSRIMAGRKVTSIDVLERIADGLRMPDEARMTLGLAPRQRASPSDTADSVHQRHPDPPVDRSWHQEVSAAAQLWEGEVNRRDVIRQAAFSTAGYTLPALRWFTAPPPRDVDRAGGRSIGQPDIDTIREMTATYRRLDNQYGGGHARETVVRYLHQEVAPILTEGRYNPATGRRLLSAVAELTQLAGWQAYDEVDHGAAQRHLAVALNFAHAAGDSVLGAEILAAMSHQATYLGHTGAGVDLSRAARRTAHLAGVTILAAEALVMEAHAHAAAKNEGACAQALHQAERTLDRADRSSVPRWLGYFDEAYLSAKFGHCFTALGKPAQAERFAVKSLRMNESYVRGKAFNLALLATVQAQRNEPDRACAIGAEALALASQLRSARAAGYLHDLRAQLAPHRRRPAVRHFTHQVDATLGPRRDGYNSPRA